MSLRDDFQMYYSGTWVGLRDDNGVIQPCYVDGVDMPRRLMDEFTKEAEESLIFIITPYSEDGHGETERVEITDPRLILETMELGYVGDKWLSLRPSHSVKKGLVANRVTGYHELPWRDVVDIFKMYNETTPLSRQFLRKEDELHYKGVKVGDVEGTTVTLLDEFQYLRGVVPKAFNGELEV